MVDIQAIDLVRINNGAHYEFMKVFHGGDDESII